MTLHNDSLDLLHPRVESLFDLGDFIAALTGRFNLMRYEEEAFVQLMVDLEADVACDEVTFSA